MGLWIPPLVFMVELSEVGYHLLREPYMYSFSCLSDLVNVTCLLSQISGLPQSVDIPGSCSRPHFVDILTNFGRI